MPRIRVSDYRRTNLTSPYTISARAEANNPSIQSTIATMNPISFLNTYHQVIKTRDPPDYRFSEKTPRGYTAKLYYLGQTWKSDPESKKKEAKKRVAAMCIETIRAQFSHYFVKVIKVMAAFDKHDTRKPKTSKTSRKMSSPQQTPRVVKWYDTERIRSNPKPMRVLLLELCQMYGFGYPQFYEKKFPNGKLNYYSCLVGERSWEPDINDIGYSYKPDAKDYIATRVFDDLFHEIKAREEEEIEENEMNQPIELATIQNIENYESTQHVENEIDQPVESMTTTQCEKKKNKKKKKKVIHFIDEGQNIELMGVPCEILSEGKEVPQISLPLINPQLVPQIMPPMWQNYADDTPVNLDPRIGPYEGPIYQKRYISLLNEVATKNRWPINYEYFYYDGGFVALVNIAGRKFRGSLQFSTNAAKDDVAQLAYSILARENSHYEYY